MHYHDRIIVDPDILIGKPVVKGTRLSVDFLLDMLAQGWPESEIIRNYPGLQHEDLLACLAYASDVVRELSVSVTAVLENSGWFKGRDVDIDQMKAKLLVGLDITTSTAANRFLKEFSGLRIALEHQTIEFDIDNVIGWFAKKEVPYLHTIVERYLCPVGYCKSGLIFLIADDYSVVLLSDQWMCYYHYKSLNDAFFSLFYPDCNLAKQMEIQDYQFPPDM